MKRSLKSILALALILTTLVVGAGTVMGATTTTTPATQAEVHGTITAINGTATPPALPSVTITPKEGPALTLKVAATTVITKAGIGTTTLDKLTVGDRANSTYDKVTMIAATISVSPPLKDYNSIVGTAKSVAASSLVVTTGKKGDVIITVNADTKYKVPGVKDATLANFKAGDKVAVLSVTSGGSNLALHIVLVPSKPAFAARVGTVDAYTANTSITVKGVKGDTSIFTITSSTKVKMEKGVTAIAVGQRVIVSARRDPATDQYTATNIKVFAAKTHGKQP